MSDYNVAFCTKQYYLTKRTSWKSSVSLGTFLTFATAREDKGTKGRLLNGETHRYYNYMLITRFRKMCLIYMMHELSSPINIIEATIFFFSFDWKGKKIQ